MTGTLLVTPDKLISTSQEFSQKATQINTLTQEMLQTVRSLNASWSDEASMTYIKQFEGLEDDMTKMYRMITEHSTDLQEMARGYNDAVKVNVQAASALAKDVIS